MEIDGASEDRHTLYVNNLFEKISQDGESDSCMVPWSPCSAPSLIKIFLAPFPAADLKKSMRCVFGQFGTILDVVSRRTYKLRGQAWVVFEKEEDAAKALQAMQGFPFFNKPIVSMEDTMGAVSTRRACPPAPLEAGFPDSPPRLPAPPCSA